MQENSNSMHLPDEAPLRTENGRRRLAAIGRFALGAACIGSFFLFMVATVMWRRGQARFEYAWCGTAVGADGRAHGWAAISWSGRLFMECESDLFTGAGAEPSRPAAQWRFHSEKTNNQEHWTTSLFSLDVDGAWLGCKTYRTMTSHYVGAGVVDRRTTRGAAIPWAGVMLATVAPGPLWIWIRTTSGRRRRRNTL